MNLDNPQRKEIRPLAATIVAEAWARTGKPKEALALLDTIELPKKDAEQIAMQARVARVFARFAANQRGPARAELVALADDDVNQLGRFVLPQFRVHPELQKLARSVFEQHPSARRAHQGADQGARVPLRAADTRAGDTPDALRRRRQRTTLARTVGLVELGSRERSTNASGRRYTAVSDERTAT